MNNNLWLKGVVLGTLTLLTAGMITACAAEPQAEQPVGCAAASTPCLTGAATVALVTDQGEVQLELNGDAAPLTAGNFLDLVQRGVYDGTVFHRVVREPTPFVVQGGDPLSANPVTPPNRYGQGNYVDPSNGQARWIPLELSLKNEDSPRYGQTLTAPNVSDQLTLTHQRGALAMARSANPNSASAQFYVALQPLPELDGRYAVFGKVSQGMEVIDRIEQGDRIVKARVVEGGTLRQPAVPLESKAP